MYGSVQQVTANKSRSTVINMDRLSDLFDSQKISDDVWIDKGRFLADADYRAMVLDKRLLDIYEEVGELRESLGLSTHKLNQKVDRYNTKMQLVDVLKYTVGLANLLGYDSCDIHTAFQEKTRRLLKEWESKKLEMTQRMKVVCIDIDGVVADYENGYMEFLERDCGLVPKPTARESYRFNDRYGITVELEEELNERFVTEGGFRDLEVYPDAERVIHWIRKESDLIPVFITARPNWQYKRISEDTQIWKEKHGFGDIPTWFDKDKADTVINKIAPAFVVAFIEDRDKHAVEIAHLGIDVFLINRSYNMNFNVKDFKTIRRVGGWGEIGKFLESL